MYIPNHFKEENEQVLLEFIRKNSFATLVTAANALPAATHIPVELEENAQGKFVLRGHVSKENAHSQAIVEGEAALMIFQGPHAYVSSGWYGHLNVPTWNYMAVHVYGRLKPMGSEDLYESLKRLADRYEEGRENKISVERMPEDFVSKMMQGVTGFEMSIEQMQGNFKLSQNRKKEDYSTIISRLEKEAAAGAHQVAQEMKKIKHRK